MRLLPYRRFTIETPLTPAEVRARLRDAIAEKWTFGWTQPEQPLVGDFDGTAFNVTRYIRGRNSFRPRVRGTIESTGSGTRLTGTMQLDTLVMVFIGAFTFAAGSAFLSAAVRSVAGRQIDPILLPAAGVLALLIAMTMGGFVIEVRRTVEELVRVVDASHTDLR
jgi:hypothetical protein